MKRVAVCACVVLVGATVACGEDRNDAGGVGTPHAQAPPGGEVVDVTLREFRVTSDLAQVEAGPVKFAAANLGTIQHELVVVRTDYPDGQIPLDGATFSEDAPGVSSPGEIAEFKPDTVEETVLDLEPGAYQLVCNVENHYRSGMHIPFEVLAPKA